MSLGLKDLKKRTASPKSNDQGAGAVSENWSRSTRTARPWSSSNLSSSKNRTRQTHVDGASMSEEWVDDHAGSFHAFNLETQSAVSMLKDLRSDLQDQAREIEQKIKRAAKSPFEIARNFLRLVQK